MRWLCREGGPADPLGCLKLVARRCACMLRGGTAPERASIVLRMRAGTGGRGAGRTWELHACAPGMAASEACIHVIPDSSCCRGAVYGCALARDEHAPGEVRARGCWAIVCPSYARMGS